jgi:hypothetical protein
MDQHGLTLADGMARSGLSIPQLWLRYVAIGGSATASQLRDHVVNETCTDDHEHDLIAQAINETFLEKGEDHPVAYRHITPRDSP